MLRLSEVTADSEASEKRGSGTLYHLSIHVSRRISNDCGMPGFSSVPHGHAEIKNYKFELQGKSVLREPNCKISSLYFRRTNVDLAVMTFDDLARDV